MFAVFASDFDHAEFDPAWTELRSAMALLGQNASLSSARLGLSPSLSFDSKGLPFTALGQIYAVSPNAPALETLNTLPIWLSGTRIFDFSAAPTETRRSDTPVLGLNRQDRVWRLTVPFEDAPEHASRLWGHLLKPLSLLDVPEPKIRKAFETLDSGLKQSPLDHHHTELLKGGLFSKSSTGISLRTQPGQVGRHALLDGLEIHLDLNTFDLKGALNLLLGLDRTQPAGSRQAFLQFQTDGQQANQTFDDVDLPSDGVWERYGFVEPQEGADAQAESIGPERIEAWLEPHSERAIRDAFLVFEGDDLQVENLQEATYTLRKVPYGGFECRLSLTFSDDMRGDPEDVIDGVLAAEDLKFTKLIG